jgi:uncharacterized membrane protein
MDFPGCIESTAVTNLPRRMPPGFLHILDSLIFLLLPVILCFALQVQTSASICGFLVEALALVLSGYVDSRLVTFVSSCLPSYLLTGLPSLLLTLF